MVSKLMLIKLKNYSHYLLQWNCFLFFCSFFLFLKSTVLYISAEQGYEEGGEEISSKMEDG